MKNGVVYTPEYIVDDMLGIIEYENMLKKKIIDPSCGDGAFLKKIVTWILNEPMIRGKKKYLEDYVYGIDIDEKAVCECISSLNEICSKFNIYNVKWKIREMDFFEFLIDNKNKFDIVIGNPPYIRIHDLSSDLNLSEIKLTNNGMKDLYLMFFEGGLKLLKDDGILLYISPNSFFTSLSGKHFRRFLIENNFLKKIVDLGHFNPFKNAVTYTCITMLQKNKTDFKIKYSTYDGQESDIVDIDYFDFYINNNFYFGLINENIDFYNIFNQKKDIVRVKNAVSTNLDKFFHHFECKTKHTTKSIKLSNGERGYSFFPYNIDGLVDFNLLTEKEKKLLERNKEDLIKRDLRGQKWYGYARSQGIKDTFTERIAFNNLIRSAGTLKIYRVPAGTVIYSGYYITIDDEFQYEEYKDQLNSESFFRYVKILNKQKNGRYYHFSTKDISLYLSYQKEKNE